MTTERWAVGENTQITHYGSDSETYTEDSAQAQPSAPASAEEKTGVSPNCAGVAHYRSR